MSDKLPGPSKAACKNVDELSFGMLSELPPNVDARDLSALSPLGVDALSSSSSDVPVPVPAPTGDAVATNI